MGRARAKEGKKGETLARHGGRAFDKFVGDHQFWAILFWDRYEALKHHANLSYDHQELRLLVESARVLLTGVLLNQVAGRKHPMAIICDSTKNYNLGMDVRELVASKPSLILT